MVRTWDCYTLSLNTVSPELSSSSSPVGAELVARLLSCECEIASRGALMYPCDALAVAISPRSSEARAIFVA